MSVARHHTEWLTLVEASGPFMSLPVLCAVFPDGLDSRDDAQVVKARLRQAQAEWADGYTAAPGIHLQWVRHVLSDLLDYRPENLREAAALPGGCSWNVAEHAERLGPTLALVTPEGREGAGGARLLIDVVPPGQGLNKALAGARWKASPATRMMVLLQGTEIKLGLVTNGADWMLVHAASGETTSFVSWQADLWLEEPLTLRAFRSLLSYRRLFGVPDAEVLEALFARSALHQHEVTDQLGLQVRRAVDVLVHTLDRLDRDSGRTLLASIAEAEVYEAAVTIMMRLVFLLAAEERGLLLLGDRLYDAHYAVTTLREQLRALADAHGEEVLARRHGAWSRLLATFRAIHGGVRHEELRLPGHGGSLFDPDRFAFLEGRAAGSPASAAAPLAVDDLTVLDLLEAVQLLEVRLPGGGPAETRRLSFRELDVEQIGHVYEGLLDHTARRATEPVVGLKGAKGRDSEIALDILEARASEGQDKLIKWLADQTGRSAAALTRALADPATSAARKTGAAPSAVEPGLWRRLLVACDNDSALAERVRPWLDLLRRDPHDHPAVIAAGSLYVTAGATRRSTGTHYTPRSLTEPVVRYTLEPLVYEGPAEGLPPERWKLKSPEAILALRVCDIAMGSGAFLVQACRYLSEHLVEAWDAAEPSGVSLATSPGGQPSIGDPAEQILPGDTEERLAIARRLVADRCLYGVDINPMAVEMAKLSLWLTTFQRGKPFTFLDHALRCGDSLLGAETVEQIEAFSLKPEEVPVGKRNGFVIGLIRECMARARASWTALAATSDRDLADMKEKYRLLEESTIATESLRLVGDALVGVKLAGDALFAAKFAVLAGVDRVSEEAIKLRLAGLLAGLQSGVLGPDHPELVEFERILDGYMSVDQPDGYRRQPFHWPREFVAVFEKGGFDAILGNPPFLGGQHLTGRLGKVYRDHLVEYRGRGKRGSADLCAYFFLRAFGILRAEGGALGMIATNTIGQGDTREVALDQMAADGLIITRAEPSMPWPGEASLEVAVVWGVKGAWNGRCRLANRVVAAITPALGEASRATGTPQRLVASRDQSFQGAIVLGMGFVMEPEEAQALIEEDPRNRDVLFPYLNGEDLNSRPDGSASRWVINFFDWPEERARDYPECYERVARLVKPERDRNNREAYRRRWWWYAERRLALYQALQGKGRVLAITLVSKIVLPMWVPTGQVFAHRLAVFPYDDDFHFGVLTSAFHWHWAVTYSSTLETRVNYSPSDCFETFPQPPMNQGVAQEGRKLDEARRALMADRQLGLTSLYNRVNDPNGADPEIGHLRELHVALDHSVGAAYGWADLDLGHGFHNIAKPGQRPDIRLTVSPAARQEILNRLLELNHQRYADEVAAGPHDSAKGKKAAKTSKGAADPRSNAGKGRGAALPLDLQKQSRQLGFGLEASPPAPAADHVGSTAASVSPLSLERLISAASDRAIDDLRAALLAALDGADRPLTKADLLAAAQLPNSAWAPLIGELTLQGKVVEFAGNGSATYALQRQA